MAITLVFTSTGCTGSIVSKNTDEPAKGETSQKSGLEKYADFFNNSATESETKDDSKDASSKAKDGKDTKSTEKSDDGKGTKETAKTSSSVKTGKKAKSGITSTDIINQVGEERSYHLSEEVKDYWTGEAIQAAAEDLAWFIAKYPNHKLNWQTYTRCIEKRRQKTGLTDAVSYPLPQEGTYDEIFDRIRRSPAFCDMVAQGLVLMAKHSGIKGSQLPAIKAFHKAHTIGVKNGKKYQKLNARSITLNPATEAGKDVITKRDKLVGYCGLELWAEYGVDKDGKVDSTVVQTNKVFDQQCAYVIAMLLPFDYTGVENVDSWFNFYLPSTCVGSDMTTRIILNKKYQEENQSTFVFLDHDKNGKITNRFGFNMKDGRLLGVIEHWRYVAKHTPPKPTPKKPTPTPTPTPNRDTGDGNGDVTERTRDKDKDEEEEEVEKEKEEEVEVRKKDEPKQDGKGVKVQSSGSAQNGHAARNSGTQSASDGDGEKRSEVKADNTVTSGSEGSGRRQVTDYNPDYATSEENHGGHATNGSTESNDTSSREAAGTKDESGATVDNEINGNNDSVQQAESKGDEGESNQAGYTAPIDSID